MCYRKVPRSLALGWGMDVSPQLELQAMRPFGTNSVVLEPPMLLGEQIPTVRGSSGVRFLQGVQRSTFTHFDKIWNI